MRDKVILGVTLTIVLLLTLVVYGFIDLQRGPATARTDRQESVNKGRALFAQYCIQCHGPVGEGAIGPALNRVTWRPEIEGEPNPDYDDGSRDLIRRTIVTGRNSNQPGIQMPPWALENNGPLNEQQIEELVAFIQYGDWSTTIEYAQSAQNLQDDLPAYPGFNDKGRLAEVKQVMLAKGCLNCHNLGRVGGLIGPELTDVGSRRTSDWLRKWIKDPKSVPAAERGPNLWLVGPTPTVPPPPGVEPSQSPQPTPQIMPMNATYMPTIEMTDEELDLLVDYLSKARTSTP